MAAPNTISLAWMLLVAFLILMTATTIQASSGDGPFSTHHINIVNLLPNLNVTVHCKSADDDIGVRVLITGDTAHPYSWSFRSNFFNRTLFFCSFQWAGGPLKHYDIFRTLRKGEEDDCDQCNWAIKTTSGVCYMPKGSTEYSSCKGWK